MLIDNKNDRYNDGLNIKTVWNFIHEYAIVPQTKGKFDIVTGYFTLSALSKLYREIPEEDEFRIISSELVKRNEEQNHIIDLLRGDNGIQPIFQLGQYVEEAKAFLKRDTVKVRAFTNAFCHAKAYLYTSSDPHKDSFYLTGSSNLTDAGLGLRASSNVELNIGEAIKKSNNDFQELLKWYEETWKAASETIPIDPAKPRGERITVKEYFLRQIDDYFRKYSPEEIYYKVLFELFNSDIDLDNSIEHRKDMSLLQTSVIWKTLFNYQQKGVISLIKMLRKYNGAILADAVGLGKTFSALAVIKYFQTQNYTTLLLCPKKLENNWTQYLRRNESRFEADEFDYIVRFHTDLQDERLGNSYNDGRLHWLQTRKKMLIVIDESHNLRNEKSSRYQELLQKLVQNIPGQEVRDVKVLMLSATPINTGLRDVKGQFNLIARGVDDAFNTDDFGVESLSNLFKDSQTKYTTWSNNPDRTIGGFIQMLPPRFFNLTDKLIVARTRSLIENTLGENLGFPQKAKPVNVYQGVDHFGAFRSTGEIYQAFDQLFLSAYQPSLFMEKTRRQSEKAAAAERWDDEVNRERFLVKMMGILFMKRLESSWYSCKQTVDKVLKVHEETLLKVKAFDEEKKKADITADPTFVFDDDDTDISLEYTLRKGTINLAEMKNIGGFQKQLESDTKKLQAIALSLQDFEQKYRAGKERDAKLDRLEEILRKKQTEPNKKVVVFTVYADTAQFIYEELRKRGFERMAVVTGGSSQQDGTVDKSFITTLQRFAPYSKLYKELDWRDLYVKAELPREHYFNDETGLWNVPYDKWQEILKNHSQGDAHYSKYAAMLDNPIDILIATDCLSEGQNLQDADLQINYDIHWNPVRLIQRFGRIDRIGSPNKLIRCVNFWPAKSLDEYLDLETRVTNRMAMMNLVGSETQELNEAYVRMVEDNPLQDQNADRLLRELQENSISDIESPRTLSLKDFSLELFRQDLLDYFEKNKDVFRKMPRGVFSGFRFRPSLFDGSVSESLVALVGYPHHEEGNVKPYKELYLLCQPVQANQSAQLKEMNRAEVLNLLRSNRNEERFVPQWIEKNDNEKLERLSAILRQWMEQKVPQTANANVLDILRGNRAAQLPADPPHRLLEEKFQLENFDLIVWEYVSNEKE